jgi:hypothetical protein
MSVNEYKIFCNTEMEFKTVWGIDSPNTCPVNPQHDINPNSISIIQTITSNTVVVETETDPNKKTNGNYGVRSWMLDIPTDTIGSITRQKTTFEYPINMMLVSFRSADNSQGDVFSCEIIPNTIIGICTTTASLGTTSISVSETVLANLNVGFLIDISTGTTSAHLGRCLTKDLATGIITTEYPVSNVTFDAGSYIKMTIRFVDRYVLTNSQNRLLGTGKIGCSYIPSNILMEVVYTNNNGLAKKFHIDMEYMF